MEKPISYTFLEGGIAKEFGLTNEISPSFFATSSFIYTLFFVAIVVAAFYRYSLAGIWRMEASSTGIKKSNDELKRVSLGLLGVFSLFLILFTVNKDMLTGDVGLGVLGVDNKNNRSATGSTGNTSNTTQSTSTNTSSNSSYAARLKSHNEIMKRLADSNIHTNRGDAPCTENQFKESEPACTSLAFLPEETIQLLLKINASCRCTLVVTGGTEPGHKTHGENKRAVDLRIQASKDTSDPLYSFIKGVGKEWPETRGCFIKYTWSSFTFCDEKPANNKHFHVG